MTCAASARARDDDAITRTTNSSASFACPRKPCGASEVALGRRGPWVVGLLVQSGPRPSQVR